MEEPVGKDVENVSQKNRVETFSIITLWKRYPHTCAYVMVNMFFVYFVVLSHINSVPSRDQLQWINTKVIKAQTNYPNLLVEKSDGSRVYLDFHDAPIQGYFGKLLQFNSATKEELARLEGCQAEIGIDHMRWSLKDYNPRAWEVRSDCFTLPYAKLAASFQKYKKWTLIEYLGDGFLIVFTFVLIRIDKKRVFTNLKEVNR